MIHVCYAVHDPSGDYSRYAGVSMASMFLHTKEEVTVHLLHDETLTEENRARFCEMAERFHQTMVFHAMDEAAYQELEWMTGHHSIATLFRLSLAEILPEDVKRLVYLDADTLVHLDIGDLWSVDLQGHSLGACVNEAGNDSALPVKDGTVAYECYFNAGILVLDMAKIRAERDLKRDALSYLQTHPESTYSDQDALNVLFRDDCQLLPERFNRQLFMEPRTRPENVPRPVLLHFAGTVSSLDLEHPSWWEREYLRAWLASPWGTGTAMAELYQALVNRHVHQLELYRKLVSCCRAGRKLVLWGSHGRFFPQVQAIFHPDPVHDYFVDSREDRQGVEVRGLPVHPPEKLLDETRGTFVVIVVAKRAYPAIKERLEAMGFRENEDFFDARALLFEKDGGYALHHLA